MRRSISRDLLKRRIGMCRALADGFSPKGLGTSARAKLFGNIQR